LLFRPHGSKAKSVFDLFQAGRLYAQVISVCDESSAQRCPVFPGISRRLHWSFPDPAALTGTEQEKLEACREIRDAIRQAVEDWCREQA